MSVALGPAPGEPVQEAGGCAVEIAKGLGLDAIGENPLQERAGEVLGRGAPKHHAPAPAQASEIETAQTRDLGLDRAGPVRAHGAACSTLA